MFVNWHTEEEEAQTEAQKAVMQKKTLNTHKVIMIKF